MENIKVGLIGAGNMGNAIILGILKSKILSHEQVYIYDRNPEKLQKIYGGTKVTLCDSAFHVCQNADFIILAVKPNAMERLLLEIKEKNDDINKSKIYISVAAGLTISFFESILGKQSKVIRTMPNTPAFVGEGITLIAKNAYVNEDEFSKVRMLFSSLGLVHPMEEAQIDKATALTGSSPAYVFMLIEAMSDAAVLAGIPRDISLKLAAQAVMGSSKLMLESGKHPGELKDMVCSPGGTTIEAVRVLEKQAFRSSIIEAMDACTKKVEMLSKRS